MITSKNPIFTTAHRGEEITPEIVSRYIKRHITSDVPRLSLLYDYYCNIHRILDRQKEANLSNNKIIAAYPQYIANFTSGYLLGEPVSYTAASGDITELKDTLKKADSATQDADLALDAAIFGRAYDYVYMSADETTYPKLARLSPLNAFVVYDDTVEQNPVFGVHYYETTDENGMKQGYKGFYATESFVQNFTLGTNYEVKASEERYPHYFGKVPIDEIYNDGQRMGDFEPVKELIDAYELLQSDRVNDKEQFVKALLLISGGYLGVDKEEKTETYNSIREYGLLELPEGANASYLTRQFDETSIEVLSKAISSDIHKFSAVPDMSDEKFSGNSSGVAMKFKLIALDQRMKTKERFFAEGLRYRIECIKNVGFAGNIDPADIEFSFKRSLPANELEIAQTVATLQSIVPTETLLAQIPFISDPEAEAAKLAEEKAQAAEQQRQAFMNTPISEM